jgi:hypothetical protein
VSGRLKAKEYSDAPMEGWKERGAEEPPAYVREAARLGRERLAEREARRAERRSANGPSGGSPPLG